MIVKNESWVTLLPINFEVGDRFELKIQWSQFKVGEVLKIIKIFGHGEALSLEFSNETETKKEVLPVFIKHEMKDMLRYVSSK